jgi:selenocysteine-specific elongation factor
MYLLQGNSVSGGGKTLVQFRFEEPIVAAPGDHFILRTLSPVQTVGGGQIIEAIPQRLKRTKPGVVEDALARSEAIATEKDFVEYCLKTAASFAANETELSLRAKVPPKKLNEILDELIASDKVVKITSTLFIHCQTARNIEGQLLDIVRDFHSKNPQSPGIPVAGFCELSHLPKNVFDGIVKSMISRGGLVERKSCMALPDYREKFSDEQQKLLTSVESLFIKRLFNPPKLAEIAQHISVPQQEVQKTLQMLIEQKQIVRVAKDIFFHQKAIARARQILTDHIEKEGQLESVKFKYLLDTSRKFALPLLDHFDNIGVTRRANNTRYLKK